MRLTTRYVKTENLVHPPTLNEGEGEIQRHGSPKEAVVGGSERFYKGASIYDVRTEGGGGYLQKQT